MWNYLPPTCIRSRGQHSHHSDQPPEISYVLCFERSKINIIIGFIIVVIVACGKTYKESDVKFYFCLFWMVCQHVTNGRFY